MQSKVAQSLTVHLDDNSSGLGLADLIVLGHALEILLVHLAVQPAVQVAPFDNGKSDESDEKFLLHSGAENSK